MNKTNFIIAVIDEAIGIAELMWGDPLFGGVMMLLGFLLVLMKV